MEALRIEKTVLNYKLNIVVHKNNELGKKTKKFNIIDNLLVAAKMIIHFLFAKPALKKQIAPGKWEHAPPLPTNPYRLMM